MSAPKSSREKPLMMHLSLAAKALADPQLQSKTRFDDDFWSRDEGREIKSSMEKVIDGIKKYQLHPFSRGETNRPVIWQDGEVRLFHYAAEKDAFARILIIPSMINGSEILDLLPGRSLLEWLAKQGMEVYLLDWGDLTKDAELKNLDLAMGAKLGKLLDWLKPQSDLPLAGLGYCMGGLLLAAAEQLHPDRFDVLCFVATPWDFKQKVDGNFAESLLNWAKDGLPQMIHIENMPAQWLQLIFAGVDPAQIAAKFSSFSDMDQGSDQAKLFVAVEDWVNGGSDLPSRIVMQTVEGWYRKNEPARGEWKLKGKPIRAENIRVPSFVVVPARDKIVPPESAKPLAKALPAATMLEADCGHISMMIGRNAEAQVWQPMLDWLLLQCNKKSAT